jgi:predicted O-methyltransferase YrrM
MKSRRLYSATGSFVGIANLPNGPVSLLQALRRKAFDRYPELPWIPFAAIRYLNTVIRKEWRVWEIGSGMSTLWLSRRVDCVTSIEADTGWYQRLQQMIVERGANNIDLRFEWRGHLMSDFSDVKDSSLDLLFIDGGPRSDCLINGFSKVRPGGYIYMDNTDVAEFWPGLAAFLDKRSGEISDVHRFVDYVPGILAVNEGTAVRKRELSPPSQNGSRDFRGGFTAEH